MNLFSNFSFSGSIKDKKERDIYKKWVDSGALDVMPIEVYLDNTGEFGLVMELEKGYQFVNDEYKTTRKPMFYGINPLIFRVYIRLKKPIDIPALVELYDNLYITNFNELNIMGIDAESEIIRLTSEEYIRRHQDI